MAKTTVKKKSTAKKTIKPARTAKPQIRPRRAPKAAKSGPYSLHPSIALVVNWVATLKEKTGRSLDEWMAHIRKAGPKDVKAAREWLKTEYKLGANSAWWLAERAFRKPGAIDEDSPEGYMQMAPRWVEEQYAGKTAPLRPIYDRLLALGLKICSDAKACPCKTMVPFYREHVFAQIKAPNASRIDLGLALAQIPETKIPKTDGRIIATGGREKKDRITHRIAIVSVDQIDGFVEKWLMTAYQLDAE